MSLYDYVNGDLVNFIDPSGQEALDSTAVHDVLESISSAASESMATEQTNANVLQANFKFDLSLMSNDYQHYINLGEHKFGYHKPFDSFWKKSDWKLDYLDWKKHDRGTWEESFYDYVKWCKNNNEN